MDVFRCLDKDGITVICPRDTWENHIVSEHPEMIGCESNVKETTEKPYQVYQDPKHPSQKNIYRPFILPKPFHTQYLRVAIKYRKRGLEAQWAIFQQLSLVRIRKRGIF